MKARLSTIRMISVAAVLCTAALAKADVATTQSENGSQTTRISVNGVSADVFLNDGETSGFLNASRDEIGDTSALDFAYTSRDGDDPEQIVLIQGAGEIPNSAFITTSDSARLVVTTPFPVVRCVVSLVTGEFECRDTASVHFDLDWARNGFASVYEKTKRTEAIGPLVTRFKGEFVSVTATVNGTWDQYTAEEMSGNLLETRNTTNLREITMDENP